MTTILGISLENRLESALEFQRIATEYGCAIRTRVGIHPTMDGVCLNRGIVLLEVAGEVDALKCALEKHWQVQMMEF